MSGFDLTGKVAVITGGNGGIGLGCATGLAKAGANIAIWARNEAKNAAAVSALTDLGVQARSYQVDLNNRSEIEAATSRTIDDFGGIDILVANAGVNIRRRPEDFTPVEISQVLQTNVTAVFECCQLVYPSMKSRGGGKIILVGSLTSIFGFGIAPIYSASKGAMVTLAKSLATAWGAQNIQVNTILPGWITTEMTEQTRAIPGLREDVIKRTPAGRWGDPSDFEGLATFLSSSASDFLTGNAITVDGGFSSTLFLVDLPTT